MEGTWLPKMVIDKATGETVSIKDYKFNPVLHEEIEEGKVIKKKVEVVEEPVVEEEEVVEEKFPCDMCEKEFKTDIALKGHKTRFHK